MAKVLKINESFRLSYDSREADSGDTVMECTINFDNPKDDNAIVTRLNTWLTAIGRPNITVQVK